MKSRVVVILLLLPTLLLGSTPSHAEDEPFVPRIAVAYDIGFLGDNSYNDAVHQALELAKKKYKLVEPFVREVPTSGTVLDRTTRLRFLAKSGYTLIIAVGSGYRDIVKRVSMEYTNTQFALINDKTLGQLNISNIYFNETQEAFLAGATAALTSKLRSVAFVAPEGDLYASFVKGAKFANPSVVTSSIDYTGNTGSLRDALAQVDVVYSMWDKDATVLQTVSTLPRTTKYIARVPDQFFITTQRLNPSVVAIISKDLKKPIDELVSYGLDDRGLIDILDEKLGIFGREYNVKSKSISLTLIGTQPASVRKKIASAIAYLSK